jgi:sugar (pentulose or hexulose) kinase
VFVAEPATGLLLGIDIGTTVTKVAVVGLDGREVSWGHASTPWRAVPTGAECDPTQLLDAVLAAAAAALAEAPPGPVAGVGVTSIAETVVYLGPAGAPVAPSIAWHDRRGEEEAADLVRTFGAEHFSRLTGLAPSTMCTLVKLAWLDRHGGPRLSHALSVADWVVHALGGEAVAEESLSSRTGALSVLERTWWAEGLEWAGAPADLFPPVRPAGWPAGHVGAGHALAGAAGDALSGGGALARLRGAALASAGHDHLCVAAGAGAVGRGQVLDSCGTAEALVTGAGALGPADVSAAVKSGLNVSCHTVPGQHALMAGHSLGLLLDRVLRLLGTDGEEGLSALDRAAEGVNPGPLRVVQTGPFDEPSIVGLHHGASPAGLWSAALDAVSAGAPRTIRAMEAIAGPARELVLSGGWARCAGLRRRKAGLLPVVRWPAVVEAGARGAALFGGCAAGMFDGPSLFPKPEDQPLGA